MTTARTVILALLFLFPALLRSQGLVPVCDFNSCLYGLKNASGKWVVAPAYNMIKPIEDNFFLAEINSEVYVLNSSGQKLIDESFSEVFPAQDNWSNSDQVRQQHAYFSYHNPVSFFIVSKNFADKKLYGLYQKNGRKIMDISYENIQSSYGRFFASDTTGILHVFTDTGIETATMAVSLQAITSNGTMILGRVSNGTPNNLGVMDITGKTIVPFAYGNIYSYGSGFFICKFFAGNDSEKFVVYNESGEKILPGEYDQISLQENNVLTTIEKNGKEKTCSVFDQKGHKILSGNYEYITLHSGKITAMRGDSTWYFHSNGKFWFSTLGLVKFWNAHHPSSSIPGSDKLNPVMVCSSYTKGDFIIDSTGKKISPGRIDRLSEILHLDTIVLYQGNSGNEVCVIRSDGNRIGNGFYQSFNYQWITSTDSSGMERRWPLLQLKKNNRTEFYNISGRKLITGSMSDYFVLYDSISVLLTKDAIGLHAYQLRDENNAAETSIKTIKFIGQYDAICRVGGKDLVHVRYNLKGEFDEPGWLYTYYGGKKYARIKTMSGECFVSANGEQVIGPVNGIEESSRSWNILTTKTDRVILLRQSDGKFIPDTTAFSVADSYMPGYYWRKPHRTPTCALNKKYAFADSIAKSQNVNSMFPNPAIPYPYTAYLWKPYAGYKPPPPSTCNCGWAIADSTGKQITDAVFGYPITLKKGIQVAYGNEGAGLYDFDAKKFIVPPIYHSIAPFAGKYFTLMTNSGNFGIIDSAGNFLTGNRWQTATLFFDGVFGLKKTGDTLASFLIKQENEYYGFNEFDMNANKIRHNSENFPAYYLLENETQKAIFTYGGKLITKLSETDSLQRLALFPGFYNDSLIWRSKIWSARKISGRKSCWNNAASILADEIIRTKKAKQKNNISTPVSYNRNYGHSESFAVTTEKENREVISGSTKTGNDFRYVITYCTDSFFSYRYRELIIPAYSGWSIPQPNIITSFHHLQKTIGGWKTASLGDFVEGDTAVIFLQLIRDAFSKSVVTGLNCTINQQLFEMVKHSYEINADGIRFIYPEFSLGISGNIEMLVTWEMIKPYAGKKNLFYYLQSNPAQ